ncbi:hypothetical protein [Egicoccus sp. AB-alg2]|uniref:hypothetical protein n=1 Tax=Egicoccus sp. AB-alg2 TaxID=3242693 RepID=UPI00359E358A
MMALLASEPGLPVVVFDSNAALRMTVVDRQSVYGLDESWDAPGVYLLDPVALDGAYGVYVGKAPAGLRTCLRQPLKGKVHWARALLVVRDTTTGGIRLRLAGLRGGCTTFWMGRRSLSRRMGTGRRTRHCRPTPESRWRRR